LNEEDVVFLPGIIQVGEVFKVFGSGDVGDLFRLVPKELVADGVVGVEMPAVTGPVFALSSG